MRRFFKTTTLRNERLLGSNYLRILFLKKDTLLVSGLFKRTVPSLKNRFLYMRFKSCSALRPTSKCFGNHLKMIGNSKIHVSTSASRTLLL
jgi:hypothetical protein